MKRVLVPLAPGFEEMEATITIDVLRRAGVEVIVAGLTTGPVEGSRGIFVVPDTTLDQVAASELDMIALPGGGPGSAALRADQRVLDLLRDLHGRGKVIAAICAAPTVLMAAGLIRGRAVTAHPAVHEELERGATNLRPADRVVVDGNLVTSQSPGTAMEFAFALVEILCGRDKVDELNASILARTG